MCKLRIQEIPDSIWKHLFLAKEGGAKIPELLVRKTGIACGKEFAGDWVITRYESGRISS